MGLSQMGSPAMLTYIDYLLQIEITVRYTCIFYFDFISIECFCICLFLGDTIGFLFLFVVILFGG